jgi:hypothetical protein
MVERTRVIDAVKKAFSKTRELQSTVSYQQTKLGAYNPSTGKSVDGVKKVSVGAFLKDITDGQSSLSNAKVGDMLAVIQVSDLSLRPEVNDVLVRGNEEYDVIAVDRDGLDLVWKLHLRKK